MALIEVPAGNVRVRRERTSMIGIFKSLGHFKKNFPKLTKLWRTAYFKKNSYEKTPLAILGLV